MLAFTPEIEAAHDWFRWTHELTEHGWQRRELPDASRGGLARQDAQTMLLLEEIRRHANQCVLDRREDERRAREIDGWRKERLKELQG